MSVNITRALAVVALAASGGLLIWSAADASAPDTSPGDDTATTDASAPDASEPDASPPDDTATDGDIATDPSATATAGDDTATDTSTAAEPIPMLGATDTLTNIDGWLNTDADSLESIRAENLVTVVQFWTFGCRNCKATLPYLRDLYADYHAAGLEIVGVHAPEFAYEADPDNIATALIDLDVHWPVALDTHKRNFHRWQPGTTAYWPRVYVIDSAGQVRFDHIGEGKYDELRDTVSRLLAEA